MFWSEDTEIGQIDQLWPIKGFPPRPELRTFSWWLRGLMGTTYNENRFAPQNFLLKYKNAEDYYNNFESFPIWQQNEIRISSV